MLSGNFASVGRGGNRDISGFNKGKWCFSSGLVSWLWDDNPEVMPELNLVSWLVRGVVGTHFFNASSFSVHTDGIPGCEITWLLVLFGTFSPLIL